MTHSQIRTKIEGLVWDTFCLLKEVRNTASKLERENPKQENQFNKMNEALHVFEKGISTLNDIEIELRRKDGELGGTLIKEQSKTPQLAEY